MTDLHSGPFHAIPGGDGSAIVIWFITEAGQYPGGYAQKIDSLGNRLWGKAGVQFTTYCLSGAGPTARYDLCSDEQGGCFIAMDIDPHPGESNIYLQHINAQGQLPWGSEARIGCAWEGGQGYPKMCSDSQGGLFVGWDDRRPPYSMWGALFINRFNSEGRPLWGEGGIFVKNYADMYQLLPDGAGGLVLYVNTTDENNTVRRYSPSGSILWHKNVGRGPDAQIVAGEPGYFYITFCAGPFGSPYTSLWAQRLGLQGQTYWPTQGDPRELLLENVQNSQVTQFDTAYRPFYFYAFFKANETSYTGITFYMQKVDSLGRLQWRSNGTLAAYYPHNDFGGNWYPVCAPDDSAGSVGVWQVRPSWSNPGDIWAKHVNADGSLGGPMYTPTSPRPLMPSTEAPQILSAPGNRIIYTLPQAGQMKLELFDLLGQRVAMLQDGYQQEGIYTIGIDNQGLPSGVYLLRLTGPFGQAAQKVVIVR